MSKILEVNDLCKSFVVKKRLLGENDVVSAVNHVSLGLEEGEVPGALHPNMRKSCCKTALQKHCTKPGTFSGPNGSKKVPGL